MAEPLPRVRAPKRRLVEIRDVKKKRIYGPPEPNLTTGNVFFFDPPQYYGFVDTVEEAPVAAQHGAATHVRIVFDCILSTWFDGLAADLSDLPPPHTIALVARSRLVELVLPTAVFALVDQVLRYRVFQNRPVLVEGSWWWLKFRTPPHPWEPAAATTVHLPAPGSTNPVSIVYAGNDGQDVLVDLLAPHKLGRLIRFSHGWVEDSGLANVDLSYP